VPATTTVPGRETLAFLHLGRPESGVRRYGQLIADEARGRPGLAIREVDAGLLDERSGRIDDAARQLAGADVVVMQWNRRGWGTRGRSLARLARFRRAYRGALVVTLHDIFERHGLRQRWLQPEAWSLRYLGRVSDRIVVHSEVEVERLQGLVPRERLSVVPHFVEHRDLLLSPDEARARLGLTGRRIVTLLGFVYGRKGHRYAVEAVPHLPDDVVMVYAGGPVAGRSFVHDLAMRKAQELDLGDRFRITGYLSEEELETWIAATHLAILPFTDLSASGSLSSWISVAKPMLASDLPGFREYERRAPGALRFFSPPEPTPLAAAIRDALVGPLDDPDPVVSRLADELSIGRTVDRYLGVLQEALAAQG
jgi:glycosyltransferase involved in cell wall biosynthesis